MSAVILGAFLLAIPSGLCAVDGHSSFQDQVKTPGRPADFKPFRFKYSTEELMEKFSTNQMQRADAELKQIQAVNDKGPWKPTWESLDQHSAPEWFLDAKLGIMLNWGIHSVPAWDRDRGDKTATYPDAYGCEMYRDEVVMPHHAKNWGADFQWDDFIPMWNAEHFDPEAMISLFQEAGAKYLITMSKHHDGMAWWDSEWTKRNTVQMGPKKDLFTPLMAAAKRHNFKTEMYFCYEEWATAMIGDDGKPCYRRWDWGTYRGTFPLSPDIRRFSGTIPVKNYYDQYMTPLVKEMIDRFDPDGLWGDGEWATPAETLRSKELIAYFYNKAQGRKEVIANDRIGQGTRDHHGDYFASEYNSTQSYDHPWEENQGISKSFAYNYEDNDESLGPPSRLIHKFIDIVSRNGNLVIIGGPDESGVYPENVVRRFKALGAWLKVNGEAIYATRALPPHQEGSVCYTRSKDSRFAYAICREWPGTSLTLKGVRANEGATITMLGVAEPLKWKQDAQGLTISISEKLQDEKARPCEHAWAIKIPMQPTVLISQKDIISPVIIAAVGSCDKVVYTLDGSEPTANSTAYTGPVALAERESNTILKARCMLAGRLVGATVSAEFCGIPKPDIYLDELSLVRMKSGNQSLQTQLRKNCIGKPIQMGGAEFSRGIGDHSGKDFAAELVYALKPEYKRFVSLVGVDDQTAGKGSIRVHIYVDDQLQTETSILRGRQAPVSLDVELPKGGKELRIVIDDAGDGYEYDDADLANAGFIVR
jgi:alpha-L-fucosidase